MIELTIWVDVFVCVLVALLACFAWPAWYTQPPGLYRTYLMYVSPFLLLAVGAMAVNVLALLRAEERGDSAAFWASTATCVMWGVLLAFGIRQRSKDLAVERVLYWQCTSFRHFQAELCKVCQVSEESEVTEVADGLK